MEAAGILVREQRALTARTGRRLQHATIAWNSVECVVALGAGFVAGSVATLWRLSRDGDEGAREAAERRAVRVVGVCFLLLAAYVLWGALGALEAETRQTEVCAVLSAVLLAGLGLNAWLGWWWADPVAGLGMVPLIAWEGMEAIRGRTCCAHEAVGTERRWRHLT